MNAIKFTLEILEKGPIHLDDICDVTGEALEQLINENKVMLTSCDEFILIK